MISTLRKYLELIRFSHTIFALPFAILSAVWASLVSVRQASTPMPTWYSAAGILVCMVSARSFAMAWNRIVDRELDAKNPRTAQRHLPSGQLNLAGVWLFTIACAGLFVIGSLLFLPNRLPVYLAIPVLLFLAGYSSTKRWTVFAHLWLGVALGLAPLCAWIAIRGNAVIENWLDPLPAILLGLGVLCWVAGFDLIYACQDTEIDRALGLKSIPAWLGNRRALQVAAGLHGLMLIPLMLIPLLCPEIQLSWLYGIGLLGVALLLVYQHTVVSPNDLNRVNLAFFQTNAVISSLLLGVGIADACIG